MGRGLVGQLLLEVQREQVQVWTESVAAEPIVENGRVVAMTVTRGGEATLVRVKQGVLIATGGFARNDKMREQYSPPPVAMAMEGRDGGKVGSGSSSGFYDSDADGLSRARW